MLKGAFCAALLSLGAAFVSLLVLRHSGLWFEQRPESYHYPLRGAYISDDSGGINWERLKAQGLDFCYIRLTKGYAFADRQGAANLKAAVKNKLTAGAVHDFDFAAGGRPQADSFISMLGSSSLLIPAIDLRMSFLERLRYRQGYELAAEINAFEKRLIEKTGRGALLLCDSYSYELLKVEASDALVWAEDYDSSGYCSSPLVISYSRNSKIKNISDTDGSILMLAAARELIEQE